MGDREKGMWKELESDHSRAVKPGRVGIGFKSTLIQYGSPLVAL